MTEIKNSAQGGSASGGKKPKTRWGCIIAVIIIFLILGGGGYIFYMYIYPVITKQLQTQSTYTPPAINKEGKEKLQNIKDYGEPIKDNEQAGRTDPFAPI
ncbi:MAG: hypothetical protein NT039_02735 [Candidatus Berkelbacteria bacterium]|nr:hypothetical protein [Candidatus Berkelbacteria bacterium]